MADSRQVRPKESIPHFGLYGESIANNDPEYVHIETIADRSKDCDWLIKLHRHDSLFQILCMYEGTVDLNIDGKESQLSGAWVVTVPPGVVHGFRFKPNTCGVVLTLAEPVLTEDSDDRSKYFFTEFLSSPYVFEIQQSTHINLQLRCYLDLLAQEFNQAKFGYESNMVCLVGMILMTLRRQSDEKCKQASIAAPASDTLKAFRALLEENYRKQWQVQQYADALGTSVSSLNRYCKESIGVTAKSVIQRRVLLEVKNRLSYTQMPIDLIAYDIGFKDPAYFSRFFKKLEGVPPSAYRKTHHKALVSS